MKKKDTVIPNKTSALKGKTLPFFKMFSESAKEFKGLYNIVICGLMGALAIVISRLFPSIPIGPYMRVGFSGYPNRIVDYLFGPVTGAIFSGSLDIIKYFLDGGSTGAFFFGYTFNAMLASVIYGIFLYKKPIKIWRIVASQFLVKMIVNVGLGTLWVSILGGKAFMAALPIRLVKNLIQWPLDSLILFCLLLTIQKAVHPFLKNAA